MSIPGNKPWLCMLDELLNVIVASKHACLCVGGCGILDREICQAGSGYGTFLFVAERNKNTNKLRVVVILPNI
jgi:hypothetical protein